MAFHTYVFVKDNNAFSKPNKMRIDRYSLLMETDLSRYWEYLGALTLTLLVLNTFIRPSSASTYTQIIGYVGLAIEAILPLPQILANQHAQSCKGFRFSVLANWLLGDTMKMGYFFMSEPGKVPLAFKMCGVFQACCDAGLGLQYWAYGDGSDEKERKTGIR